MFFRYDSSGLRSRPKVTSQGFLSLSANLTRTGVLTYRRADGSSVRELRHPDEVFSPKTMESIQYAPLTDGHPDSGFVSPDNVSGLQRGIVQAARADGRFVVGEVLVQEASMIAAVKSGDRRELSPGYTCDVDPTPGEYNGERYDQIQRNIVYNHVAALPKGHGRSGAEVSFRNDSEAYEIDDSTEEPEMKIEKKIEVEMVEKTTLDAAVMRADSLSAEVEASKKEAEKVIAERDELKARLDSLDVPALVAARVALESTARLVCGADARFDGKTDREVKEIAIKVSNPTIELGARSEDYVSARFDSVVEFAQAAAQKDVKAIESLKQTQEIAGLPTKREDSADDVRAKMIEKSRNAWKA